MVLVGAREAINGELTPSMAFTTGEATGSSRTRWSRSAYRGSCGAGGVGPMRSGGGAPPARAPGLPPNFSRQASAELVKSSV